MAAEDSLEVHSLHLGGNGFQRRLTMRLFLVFGGLLIIQLVIGCSGRTPPAPKTPTSALTGHWRQTHLGIGGQLKQCPASVTIPAGGAISCGANDRVEFRPDGTFVASVSGLDAKISGKWRVEGSTLLVTFIEPSEVAGTNTSAVVQFDPSFNRITINTTSGATPTAAIYVRE